MPDFSASLPWASPPRDLADYLHIPEWHDRAACRDVTDPEIFFPERGGTKRWAANVCKSCRVSSECLQQALEGDEWGVWAGTTPKDRQALQKDMSA